MRKFYSLFALAALLMFGIVACEKERFSEDDALNTEVKQEQMADSVAKVREEMKRAEGVVSYSVNIYNAGNGATIKKTALINESVEGTRVVVSQYGYVDTAVVDASGIAVFKDMRAGDISVHISKDGFTDVNYLAHVPTSGEHEQDKYGHWISTGCGDCVRQAANFIPIWPVTGETTATIKGMITAETDLTNTTIEPAVGVEVIARIDVEDADFRDKYIYSLNRRTKPGGAVQDTDTLYTSILQLNYGNLSSKGITDANGEYTLQIPAVADEDGLPIEIEVSDWVANQTLYMNRNQGDWPMGVQTVRTVFGSMIGTAPTVPFVRAALVTFGDPDGVVNLQPHTDASATANVAQSGVKSIAVTNGGEGYTQAPLVVVDAPDAVEWDPDYGTRAVATATIDADGVVTGITVDNGGNGYSPDENIGVTIQTAPEYYSTQATAELDVTYSITTTQLTVGNGKLTNAGSGYTTAPAVTIVGQNGTGAVAEAVVDGTVNTTVTVDTQGSGYTQAPDVFINGGGGTGATATSTLASVGTIFSIELATPFGAYDKADAEFTGNPDIEVRAAIGGTGSGSTGKGVWASTGSIATGVITVSSVTGGSGYAAAPNVVISGGGTGATAVATIVGGIVTQVNVTAGGSGYTSAAITIDPPAGVGGAQATIPAADIPDVLYAIESITVSTAGSDYSTNPRVILEPGTAFETTVTGTTVTRARGVESVTITNQGEGYTSAPTASFTPVDGNEGTKPTTTLTIDQVIKEINITNGGTGFKAGEQIQVSIAAPPAGGTTATAALAAAADLGDGVINPTITIIDGGDNYTATPYVEFGGTAKGGLELNKPMFNATVTSGKVSAINLVTGKEGKLAYAASHPITIKTEVAAATASAKPYAESGQVTSVDITNAGEGYTVAPTVRFVTKDASNNVVNHRGTPAVATAVIDDGRVVAINITEQGTGYYRAPEVILEVLDKKKRAEGYAKVNADGYVTDIVVTDTGLGYNTAPVVTITGLNGVGADATAVAFLDNLTTGSIKSKVEITNVGSGYLAYNRYRGGPAFSTNAGAVAGGSVPYIDGKKTGSSVVIEVYGHGGNTWLPSNQTDVVSGKTYVMDIDLGTGNRTTSDDDE